MMSLIDLFSFPFLFIQLIIWSASCLFNQSFSDSCLFNYFATSTPVTYMDIYERLVEPCHHSTLASTAWPSVAVLQYFHC